MHQKEADVKISHVITASAVGTMVEWYDFYIFGSLATVISPLFYPKGNDTLALIAYLSTFAVGFMASTLGFGMAQRTGIIAAVVPDHEIGSASAILALTRNIAGAFGIALFSTILQTAQENRLYSIAANSHINSTDPKVIQQGIALIELKAQVSAYATVFEWASLIVVIGAFVALLMKVDMRRVTQGQGAVHTE
jgi:hypothetical protein